MLSIGLAADHGGVRLKTFLKSYLQGKGHKVKDFGAYELNEDDNYPDFVVPLARAVAQGGFDRGIAVCGSGVGASVIANKIRGIRAALIHDVYSAHQGVEDDDMNILCLGGRTLGSALAADLVNAFLDARFRGEARYQRRLDAITALERER